jgi:hypothetical protein
MRSALNENNFSHLMGIVRPSGFERLTFYSEEKAQSVTMLQNSFVYWWFSFDPVNCTSELEPKRVVA